MTLWLLSNRFASWRWPRRRIVGFPVDFFEPVAGNCLAPGYYDISCLTISSSKDPLAAE